MWSARIYSSFGLRDLSRCNIESLQDYRLPKLLS